MLSWWRTLGATQRCGTNLWCSNLRGSLLILVAATVHEASDLFDITGSREIKMMPFGEGRRICPAIGLALLHLELFVANLVWYFEWKTVGGNTVDLSEKQEFITVMKEAKYGPIFTLRVGSRPAIFIGTPTLAYRALVQNGAVFADRPEALAAGKIISNHQRNISSAGYGPTWRLLRRNLAAEILHPSRARSYSAARQWALAILFNRLVPEPHLAPAEGVRVVDHFQHAVFCLLVFTCFGDKLEEEQIREVERVQRQLLVHTWVDLELLEDERKLNEKEMVSLCSEFLDAGTDTTSTALQWIMANLVKYPRVQTKLYEEIHGIVGPSPQLEGKNEKEVIVMIKEEDLQRMCYLKFVVLEGLRRHPS
ncbi:hypothetical protein RHGRI_008855 [Rhododendron griersonianum]|uniref:Cytochrome P450 n=1 Tax=Rhododendron griersonianum TaxID=479676 RepID=A0AAV6L583_9ERIC|nr:hypothetical protein RHGRI_008855 [Rhododendron griersonianum]